jgi:hypothetical protein
LTQRCEDKVFEMTAKDIALLAWCIARLELPAKHPFFQKTFRIMEKYV